VSQEGIQDHGVVDIDEKAQTLVFMRLFPRVGVLSMGTGKGEVLFQRFSVFLESPEVYAILAFDFL
jgi:hypothetical protein